jgi:hypothetical protein
VQGAGGAEEEGRYSRTVREPHSPPLYLTAGSPVPSRRPVRRLWPAAVAVSVLAIAVPVVPALSSAVSVPRAADSTPCIPAAPSDDSSWYAVRPCAPHTPAGNTCFKCGEVRHYANACPKRHPQAPLCRTSRCSR